MHTPITFCLLIGIASAVRTMIPTTVFDSQTDFDTDFEYLYPWGTDHNGAARMNSTQVTITNSTLTLTATPVTGQPSTTQGGKTIAINYLSGAVHAKETFTVEATGGYDFTGEFLAPTTKGTWPAFWLTAVSGWPPEIDLAEWKGDGDVSFNTFNTSSVVAAKDVEYANPDDFHTIKAEVRDLNGADVQTSFYLDGTLVTTQVGKDYVGKAQYL